ncbi:MAG: tRNA lysidine(34) synthetase TilS [Pseudolabrys sp.]|nr:tRNA lysidine(34) synthetase TilS [Pseudolabrys sp.]MSP31367.1 tRNA lysidine(34) synthetase TilS [Pseudolabrys sp.]
MRTASAQKSTSVTATEAKSLFSDLDHLPALVLAVSGGPDSTALMVLAARWRNALETKPKLIAVTVDHGLRAESKREAASVGRLARKLKVAHRTLRWTGKKPKTGLPQAARQARYRLLAEAARNVGASHILTAHTLDDQAETVLIRLLRGSGVTGLAAMQKISVIPGREQSERTRNDKVFLMRPLLDISKARLIATLRAAKIAYADDPSNRDPRFTRARLRALMPQLAQEGLDARRLALLAQRIKRADAAIEAVVDQAIDFLAVDAPAPRVLAFEAGGFFILPAEIVLRVIGRAVAKVGDQGPVELAKLEALKAALDIAQKSGNKRFRRSLAGAMVTLAANKITVERAPPRRKTPLTTQPRDQAKRSKAR